MLSFSSVIVLAAGLSTLLPAATAASSNSNNVVAGVPRHVKGRSTGSDALHHQQAGGVGKRGSNSRRHHARLAAAKRNYGGIPPADLQSPNNGSASNTSPNKRGLLSGTGFGTLYYDMNGGGTCGPANGWSTFAETGGYAMCEPNAGYKTLAQRGSNRVVAMPSELLSGHLAEYCGKEVKVTYNGKTVDNLVIWDGCAACNGANGLDFSSTVFAEIFGEDNCSKGKIYDMSWEITGTQLWEYGTGNVLSGGGSSDDSDAGEAAPAPSPSSTWSPAPEEPSSTSSSSSSTPVAQPTKPWSSSSTWTSSSSSSSSSGEDAPVEPATTKSVVNGQGVIKPHGDKEFSSMSSQKQLVAVTSTAPVQTSADDEQLATSTSDAAEVPSETPSATRTVNPKTVETRPEAEATTTESSSSSEQEVAPAPAPTSTTPSSDGEGQACNDTPGAWVCSGNTMQQCVQTTGDWVWLTRVHCDVAPINCDSPNPVCPGIASGI